MLPGGYERLTSDQCNELVKAGWIIALGGEKNLNLKENTAETRKKLDEYLGKYKQAVENRVSTKVRFFCFEENEYFEEYDGILKAHDITALRCYEEDKISGSNQTLLKFSSCKAAENTEIDGLINTLAEHENIILCTREVGEEPDNKDEDITLDKYKKIIEQIQDSRDMELVSAKDLLQ